MRRAVWLSWYRGHIDLLTLLANWAPCGAVAVSAGSQSEEMHRVKSKMPLPMLAAAGLTAATSADVFTDRAEFDDANPDLPILDFEGIAPSGALLQPAPDFSPFGVTFSGPVAIVDSDYFTDTPTDVLVINSFDTPLFMTFDPHVFAAGFDVAIGFGGHEATVEAFSGDTLLASLSFDTETEVLFTTFIGFSNVGEDITHILVTPPPGRFVLIDNLAFGDACPGSDFADTIVIDDCDSGVENAPLGDGCTMADLIAQCAQSAATHGDFVGCVAVLASEWVQSGLITGVEKSSIQDCAAQANIPFVPATVTLPTGNIVQVFDPADLIGGPFTVEDFEDDLFEPGATYSAPTGVFRVPASAAAHGVTPSGEWGLASNQPTAITIAFDTPPSSVGLWFGNDDTCCGSGGFDAIITIYDAGGLAGMITVTANMNDWADQFVGFNSNLAVTHVVFLFSPSALNLDIYIDDVYFNVFQEDSDKDGIPDDEDSCPDSDLTTTIIINGCDSGVENMLFEDGCTMADLIAQCADCPHRAFVSCVALLGSEWVEAGLITGHEKAMIVVCAAQSDIPKGARPQLRGL